MEFTTSFVPHGAIQTVVELPYGANLGYVEFDSRHETVTVRRFHSGVGLDSTLTLDQVLEALAFGTAGAPGRNMLYLTGDNDTPTHIAIFGPGSLFWIGVPIADINALLQRVAHRVAQPA